MSFAIFLDKAEVEHEVTLSILYSFIKQDQNTHSRYFGLLSLSKH